MNNLTISRWLAACVALLALQLAGTAQNYFYDEYGAPRRVEYANGTTIDIGTDLGGNLLSKKVFLRGTGGGGGGGGGCFIATAAYGSALDPHVQALRDFREGWLRPYAPGRAFIACYERFSPPLAALIAQSELARAATRVALAPLVYSVAFPRTALIAWTLLAALSLRAWRRRRAARYALA